jgi:hypothetical protein
MDSIVHNLLIWSLLLKTVESLLKTKRGENSPLLPSYLKKPRRKTESTKDYFTALLSRLPALNFATRVAGILISFPV